MNLAADGYDPNWRPIDLVDFCKNSVTVDGDRLPFNMELGPLAIQIDDVFHAASGTSLHTVSM
jgi:hypothetical protein